MADTKKKMMQWLDDTGNTLNMPGSLVVAESTGEDFQTHSADTTKHLTAAEKAALKHQKQIHVVDDLAARDAIAEPFTGLSAYAKNATGDSTVSKGGAYYLYDGATWIKTSEAESMDVVLPLSNEQLLDINAKKHTHANAVSLDKLSVDADGLKVDGAPVGSIAFVTGPEDTPVYNGKIRIVVSEYTPPVQA